MTGVAALAGCSGSDRGSGSSGDDTGSGGGDAEEPGAFDVGSALHAASERDCAYVHPSVAPCLETEFVNAARDRGFGVNARTAGADSEISALRNWGVDGAVIDDCGLAPACRSGRQLHQLHDEDAGEP